MYIHIWKYKPTHRKTDIKKSAYKCGKRLIGDLDKRYKGFVTIFFNFSIGWICFNIKHQRKKNKRMILFLLLFRKEGI